MKIDTESILLYLLSHKENELDFQALKNIENKIFKYDPFLFIDFNQDTICSIIEKNPKIFVWSNNTIKKTDHFDQEQNRFSSDSQIPGALKAILQ